MFVVDLVTPPGLEVWVWYLPVILAPVWFNNVRAVIVASAACSVLVVVGVFISPAGSNPAWWDLLNRGMGLAALWLMAFAGITIARRSLLVAETMANLWVAVKRHEQAERALAHNEERLRLVVAGAGMGTWDVDLRTGKAIWSETQFRMLGYEPLPGGEATLAMWQGCVYPDDQGRVREAQEQARRKRSPYGVEYRIRRADNGALAWLAVFGRFLYGAAGEAVGFAGVSFDITQRKELERKVLEIAVQEQRRIGQELHDSVGQELTGLGLMADALAQRLPETAAEKPIAARLVAGLDRVHQQVRVLSRGLVPVQVEAEGLRAALSDLAVRTTEQSGIPVTFDYSARVEVRNHTTAMQLFRITQEAVSNALRHGQPRRVHLALHAADEGLRLSVQDDGMGMQSPLEESEGMGLGIMRYRAGLIGGVLRITPAEGGGTVVTCTLPERKSHDEGGPGNGAGGAHPDRG
jgi:PAS domain S-box-containing protein